MIRLSGCGESLWAFGAGSPGARPAGGRFRPASTARAAASSRALDARTVSRRLSRRGGSSDGSAAVPPSAGAAFAGAASAFIPDGAVRPRAPGPPGPGPVSFLSGAARRRGPPRPGAPWPRGPPRASARRRAGPRARRAPGAQGPGRLAAPDTLPVAGLARGGQRPDGLPFEALFLFLRPYRGSWPRACRRCPGPWSRRPTGSRSSPGPSPGPPGRPRRTAPGSRPGAGGGTRGPSGAAGFARRQHARGDALLYLPGDLPGRERAGRAVVDEDLHHHRRLAGRGAPAVPLVGGVEGGQVERSG